MRILKYLLFFSITIALAYLAVYLVRREQNHIVADNAYVTGEIVTLRAPFQGRFEGFSKQNGDQVKQGELLANLGGESIIQEREVARLAVEKAVQDEIKSCLNAEQDNDDLKIAISQLDEANRNLDREKTMMAAKLISVERMEKAERSVLLAELQVNRLQAAFDKNSVDLHVPILQRIQVRTRVQEFLRVQTRLQLSDITSSIDGVIYKIHAHAGDMLSEGDSLVEIVPTASHFVEALVLETDIQRIDLNQDVKVTPSTNSGVELRGRVQRVMPSAASMFSPLPRNNVDSNWVKVTQRIPVLIKLEESAISKSLPLGATVSVTFASRNNGVVTGAGPSVENAQLAPAATPRPVKLNVESVVRDLNSRYLRSRLGQCRLG